MPTNTDHDRDLVDSKGHPIKSAFSLKKQLKRRLSRATLTGVAAWVGCIYAIVMGCDSLTTIWQRRFSSPQDVTISDFEYIARTSDFNKWYPPEVPPRTVESDTDYVDLKFKLVNNSTQTILIERVEVEFVAKGSVPEGGFKTSTLELSAQYLLKVPDLRPNEKAELYVEVPHVLKPNEADAFKVILAWPPSVAITGEYLVQPRIVSSVGVQALEAFSVPVLSDAVLVDRKSD